MSNASTPSPFRCFFPLLLSLCPSLAILAQTAADHSETYGVLNINTGQLRHIALAQDGNLLIGGQSDQHAVLAKIDCAGKVLAAADLSTVLPDTGVVTDILPLANGALVVVGHCRHCGGSDMPAGKVFALKTGPDLVVDGSVGLHTYAAFGNDLVSNVSNPVIARQGNEFVLAYQDDFFGGNLELATLDAALNKQSHQIFNFSFIEGDPSLVAGGNSIFVAESTFAFGETPKISVAKFDDFDGDGTPNLIWEKKYEGALLKRLLRSPANGDLFLAGTRRIPVSGEDHDAMMLLRLDANSGDLLDSLLQPGLAGYDRQSWDLAETESGDLLWGGQYLYLPHDLQAQTAQLLRVVTFTPMQVAAAKVMQAPDDAAAPRFVNVLPLNAGGSEYALAGSRFDAHPLPYFSSLSSQACPPFSAPLNGFDPCGPGALEQPDCPAYPYCQPYVIRHVVYDPAAIDVQGNPVALYMDIYLPRAVHDQAGNTQKRPTILAIHGGGFLSGDEDDYALRAFELAQYGFVVASMTYRLGVPNPDPCANPAQEFSRAGFRAIQDARKALNFLKANAATYHIDPEALFVHGFSAGAITALSLAYITENDLDDLEAAGVNIQDLGPLPPAVPVRAVFPYSGTNFLPVDADEKTPVYLVNGTCDPLVPLDSGTVLCPNWTSVLGVLPTANALVANGSPLSLHLYKGGGHGLPYELETAMLAELRTYIKEKILCGPTPLLECFTYEVDLSQPCADIPDCAQLLAAPELPDQPGLQPEFSPNPFDQAFTLVLPEGLVAADAELTLFDLQGKVVWRQSLSQSTALIHPKALTRGLYVARVVTRGKVFVAQVVKQ